MITREEFLNAIELITEYKKQIENDLVLIDDCLKENIDNKFGNERLIKHIHFDMCKTIFKVLNPKYESALIPKEKIINMTVSQLEGFHVDQLIKYKNIGKIRIRKLKSVLINFNVNFK